MNAVWTMNGNTELCKKQVHLIASLIGAMHVSSAEAGEDHLQEIMHCSDGVLF